LQEETQSCAQEIKKRLIRIRIVRKVTKMLSIFIVIVWITIYLHVNLFFKSNASKFTIALFFNIFN
jgi:hypothetical protein